MIDFQWEAFSSFPHEFVSASAALLSSSSGSTMKIFLLLFTLSIPVEFDRLFIII
jgi:hypothetical protein